MAFRNIRAFHERLNAIFNITLALPLLPMGYLYLEINHRGWIPLMNGSGLVYTSALVSAILVSLFSFTHYRGNLEKVREQEGLGHKFQALFKEYRKLYLGNLLANLILVTGYYLTGWEYLIGFYVFLLFALSIWRPYHERYNRDLELDSATAMEVRKLNLSFENTEEQE